PGTAQHTARRPAPRHTEAHHTTPQTQAVTAEVDVATWTSAVTACVCRAGGREGPRSEEHTSELQSRFDLVCRLLLEKKKQGETKSYFSLLSAPCRPHYLLQL